MNEIANVGVDLAKRVIVVCAAERTVPVPSLPRMDRGALDWPRDKTGAAQISTKQLN